MTELPSQIDQWTVLVGALLPLLVAIINRQAWGAPLKAAVSVAACALAALGDVYFKDELSGTNYGQTLLAIFFLVVTTYQGFWKPTGIAGKIEEKT